MSRPGNCRDNAAESFFSTLKTERLSRTHYRSRDEKRADAFDYIEHFYDPKRRHSALGYLSQATFEKLRAARVSGIPNLDISLANSSSARGTKGSRGTQKYKRENSGMIHIPTLTVSAPELSGHNIRSHFMHKLSLAAGALMALAVSSTFAQGLNVGGGMNAGIGGMGVGGSLMGGARMGDLGMGEDDRMLRNAQRQASRAAGSHQTPATPAMPSPATAVNAINSYPKPAIPTTPAMPSPATAMNAINSYPKPAIPTTPAMPSPATAMNAINSYPKPAMPTTPALPAAPMGTPSSGNGMSADASTSASAGPASASGSVQADAN